MRLFAAVVPPDDVLDSLEAAVTRARAKAGDDAGLAWNERRLWHLTLAFYGADDPDERAGMLADRLHGRPSLRINISASGMFRGVLWAGVDGELASLRALAASVQQSRPDRSYHPHVTLARWKADRPPWSARMTAEALSSYRGPRWRVDEVVLMRSARTERGLSYSTQQRFGLV